MAVAICEVKPELEVGEQRLVLRGVGYRNYELINDAIGENAGVRLIYVAGRLTFLTASRRHEWYAERLAELVKVIASATGINWEDSGSATYRRGANEVGVEADKAFYLGDNADRMRGAQDIDLETQPPPDLAIEVEVTHSADDAMIVYAKLGVPEVWRFDVKTWHLSFNLRNEKGEYERSPRSRAFPNLESSPIPPLLRQADEIGASFWFGQLNQWVQTTILPRPAEG